MHAQTTFLPCAGHVETRAYPRTERLRRDAFFIAGTRTTIATVSGVIVVVSRALTGSAPGDPRWARRAADGIAAT